MEAFYLLSVGVIGSPHDIAVGHNATLCTFNVKHYRAVGWVPGVNPTPSFNWIYRIWSKTGHWTLRKYREHQPRSTFRAREWVIYRSFSSQIGLFSFLCGRRKNRGNFPEIYSSNPCLARLLGTINTDYHTKSRGAEFPPDHSHIWYFWISKKPKDIIQQGF